MFHTQNLGAIGLVHSNICYSCFIGGLNVYDARCNCDSNRLLLRESRLISDWAPKDGQLVEENPVVGDIIVIDC